MTERIVLITAVGGGGVGEQLVKSLRLAARPYTIVGADADARSLGFSDVDLPVILPLAGAPGYIDQVLGVCARFGVRAIYPGSEPELLVLSAARDRVAGAGLVLFANSAEVIATGLDKARTATVLEKAGFRPPRSLLLSRPEDLARVPFLPAVLKPNSAGGGSANVFVAQTEAEYKLFGAYLLEAGRSCLAQEYVGTSADEYTVGVLSDLDGAFINSIALRRNILPAFSNRSRAPNRTGNATFGDQLVVSNGISQGDIGPFPEVTAACERIATALDSRGPINIQCRLADGEVRVFEINPRFSGSASLRALVGFNEPDLLYRRHVEGERLTPRFAYRSGHIARGLREVLIDPALSGVAPGTGGFRWSTPPLPFIFRPLESPANPGGIPDSLPLTVSVDGATGRLCQLPDPAVADALTRAYAAGSEIPGLMEASGIGREYADDFLALLAEAGGSPRVDGLRVLEIGCGTGYLLSRLKDLGGQVQGIEPGPQGQRGAGLYGVPVAQDTFPSSRIAGEFDLIVLYLVLEHLPDPAEFLRSVRRQLAPSGRVALVVPDAERFLVEGDASILFHEHYSYFTGTTLAATLQAAGADQVAVRRSRLSRLLFALAGFGGATAGAAPSGPDRAASFALAHRFRTSASRIAARLAAWLADARHRNESVGIYVPGRFANYVALGGIDPTGLRFFDDSPALQGHYFPGIPVAVEGQDALVGRPTSRVLVMSASFGERIRTRLQPLLPATTRITTLDELLPMIAGFVSDAHGNPEGLDACLRVLKREGVERIFFLGDAVGYLPEENAVLDLLRQCGAACVRGNHDAMLLGDLPLSEERDRAYRIGEARKRINARHLDWMRTWPERLESEVGDRRALLVHGSPAEPLVGYVYPDGDLGPFAALPFDLVAMGHTHRPVNARSGSVSLLNPGSCGMPRDVGHLAACATWNSGTGQIEVLRVPFDAATLIQRWGDAIHASAAACLLRALDAPLDGRLVTA